ncbi:MAG: Swt1 family HEPN domain-containing protein [Anaerolineae bacterium]
MALTNRDRVGKALELLQQGLRPYVQREMEAEYRSAWLKQAAYSLHKDEGWADSDPFLDAQALLVIMWDQWNSVFKETLGFAERAIVSELREARNTWAHQAPFTTDDAYRALDSIARLLTAISAPEAQEVERQKQELLRLKFEEQARHERRKAAIAPTEGRPSGSLLPWREVVTPHPDVASGRYLQAEFAADLWQVYMGEGAGEYRDPLQFFERTFITDGLRRLLVNALRRLDGQNADPVIELQTNFGGGKTHSMLALFHLFSGAPVGRLAGVEPLVREAGAAPPPTVHRAVLVGNKISPGQPSRKPDGTVVHTLWGELAWQLGGAEAYALLADDDRNATNPGDPLRLLFNRYAPCLLLVDEWVAYARQLHDRADLPGGCFDTHFTFAQTLTEAAKAADRCLLVVSMPASEIEMGGERGKVALDRLKNAIGRLESPWRPASAEEGFEIVRRRLFQPLTDTSKFAARDLVVGSFARMYREQPQDFPAETREGAYERRMQAAYPIHPELFDRLYSEWSSLEKFQRTRGVLRLMAAVIHALWERGDSNLLILPATVPIDDANVQAELTRYLDDNWVPVIERDVDGPASLPLKLDRDNPTLGRFSASRRVARTIYLGSAPTAKASNPGIDDRSIRLGCAQPGENVAAFGDALRRLTDNATHLYVDRSRYWYNTQPSVGRLAQDRAAQMDREDHIWPELKRRLRADRQRGEFSAVHAAPDSSGDVPDEMTTRLVILGPGYPHTRRDPASKALSEARSILAWRGSAPRLYQNMVVFLAPDSNRLPELEDAIRHYLAWKSIDDEKDTLNLDTFQRNQAKTKHEQADQTVNARIKEAYVWLLSPHQEDPQDPQTLNIDEAKLAGQDSLAVQASRKLKNEDWLSTEFGGVPLRMAMDRYNLWQGAERVLLRQLWEYFARYPYLPRLCAQDVLLGAVQNGVGQITWHENFAYAAGWDDSRQRYLGLRAGENTSVLLDGQSLLVKPAAAQRQIDADRQEQEKRTPPPGGEGTGTTVRTPPPGGETPPPPDPQPPVVRHRRFHGSVKLDTLRLSSQAGAVHEAVVQHLQSLVGAEVQVTLEIQAYLPDGAPENVVRTVTENARTLRFEGFGFEDT